jgi:catechol 2,3-dioxygenase-like lactoylglutathione lyase family enzyme
MFWIDHVGLVVRNMPESIAFYTKLLGDGPIDRVEWRGEHAAQVARMLDRPGLELDAVFFRIPHTNAILELVEYFHIDQETVSAPGTWIGATHIGFAVENLDATVARLGLTLTGDPVLLTTGPYRGGRSAYLKDPNGVNIQLMELRGRPGRLPVLRPGDPPAEVAPPPAASAPLDAAG